MIVCQLALRWKFHAAPTGAVIEPGPGCRELPLSDLYHNVAVTAIQIAFNLLIKENSPELREFEPALLPVG